MANQLPGMIIGIEFPVVIPFQWNPQIINVHKKPSWHKLYPAGAEGPVYHYGAGEPDTSSFLMDLSKSGGGVANVMEALKQLTKPVVRGWGVKRPPLVSLVIGATIQQVGFIVDVKGAYGPIFDPRTYVALQGKVTVTFEEVRLWNL